MNIFDSLLRYVAPHECLVCYQEGVLLCTDCQRSTIQPLERRCYRCFDVCGVRRICASCAPRTSLSCVWVATEHAAAARELIRALKFARAQSAARLAAELMNNLLPPFPPGSVLVPVPTATQRVRERGYDQAALIAKRLAKLRVLPYQKLLKRSGQTRQVGASRMQRQRQLQAAFVVTRPLPVQHIILVDDVVTTGATIEAAAHMLKKNGAQQVSAALFSQKPK